MTRCRFLFGLLMVLGALACASPPGGSDSPPGSDQGALRYKGDGPPCMCSSGLSEADIQKAMKPQKKKGSDKEQGKHPEKKKGDRP